MEDFKNKAIRGIKWNFTEQVVVSFFTFAGTIVLSRILLPEHFGLFGMLTVLGNLATLIVGMGLSYSVINNQDLLPEDLSTVFWFNLSLGFFMAAAFFFSAPFIAAFYHQPELITITRLFSLGFIAQGANAVSVGLLIKFMKFNRLAVSNISGTLFAYMASVSLAFAGYGVWSLVVHFLVLHFVTVTVNLLMARWIPALDFRMSALHKVKKFSSHFLGSQLIDFTSNNLDSLLIGKYVGKRDLGFYGRATALVTIPVTSLGYVLNRTLFPWFSALQNNINDLRFRYSQALKILVLIIWPILILVGMQAEDVVVLLFGKPWIESARYVMLLSVIAAFQSINAFNDSFLISQGRSDILLKISIVEKSLLIIGVIIGLKLGVAGIIIAKIIVLSLMIIPRIASICHVIQTSLLQWIRNLTPLLTGLVFMIATAWLTGQATQSIGYVIRLVLVSVTSLGVYYLYLIITRNSTLREVRRLAGEQVKKLFFPHK
ncbi:MAG: lipopolysaccharide biosynthesis protein [Cyclobacteriaceae bacterium]|nr:lipopolysaccharide biosynthesis protein [Cyclobacteriaceae bacterium]MDW8331331.1 lipopolysaccharide biosynthesis protein [Cyclobacteriaceae bacterium]